MGITALDYVELYVADLDVAVERFGRRLALPATAHHDESSSAQPHRSVTLDVGASSLVLTAAAGGGDGAHPAAAWSRRHGDGVGNVGLRVPDAAAAYARAVAGGATPVAAPHRRVRRGEGVVEAAVLGVGDVAHTFVERDGPTPSAGPGAPVLGVDHLAACVPAADLKPTAELYEAAFGCTRSFELYVSVGPQAMDSIVVEDPTGSLVVTLVAQDPVLDPGQVDTFLADHGGAGIQHVALRVAEIVGSIQALRRNGTELLDVPSTYYDAIQSANGFPGDEVDRWREFQVLCDRDQWGDILQVFTRSTHDRGTIFFELVERRGARTFGSGNVRALYEAVRRAGGADGGGPG